MAWASLGGDEREEFFSARELFCATLAAVKECRRAEWMQLQLVEGQKRGDGLGTHNGSGHSDPSCVKALALLRLDEATLRHAKRASKLVGVCSDVLYGTEESGFTNGLESLGGKAWADTLNLHYLQDVSWDEVAKLLSCSKRTAIRWADAGLDYIDAHGLNDVIMGVGHAESGVGTSDR